MNDTEQYVADAIHQWVWSGFYDQADIDSMIEDIIEEDCDVDQLRGLIGPALRDKLQAERQWPQVTDCDRLDQVFVALHAAGICALANAGYTMSDGHSDVAQVLDAAPARHYTGYCFYHGQDVERAIEGGGVMLAFGACDDDPAGNLRAGQAIAQVLRDAGFVVDWDGTAATRINLPALDWKRRAASAGVATMEAFL